MLKLMVLLTLWLLPVPHPKPVDPQPIIVNVPHQTVQMNLPQSKKDAWDKTLVFVGIAGIFTAVGTLRYIARQTNATIVAANAAKASADALIGSERAWIQIGVDEKWIIQAGQNSQLIWRLRNAGRTPARLIETQCVYELVHKSNLNKLPSTPTYSKAVELNRLLLVPTDSIPFTTCLVNDRDSIPIPLEVKDIISEQFFLRAYGYVKYLDVFDRECESSFCQFYRQSPPPNTPQAFYPMLDAPAEYMRYT